MIVSTDRPTDVIAGLLEARLSGSDSVAIEDVIGEFFSAYNTMDYDKCLDHVLEPVSENGCGVPGLLKEARNATGPVVIQSVNRMEIVYSRGTAVLKIVLRSEVSKKRVSLVKQGKSWKLEWDSIADPCVVAALRRVREEA